MAVQHLQLGRPQPAELPSRLGVIGMMTGVIDTGGLVQFFSLALTSSLLKFLGIFMLRHALGMCSFSAVVGFRLVCRDLVSRSGVYSTTRNVSNGQGPLSVCNRVCGLFS